MNNRFVMLRNALLVGVSFGLAACGGGAGGPALVTTPPPAVAPTPAPTPTPTPVVDDTKTITEGLTVRQNGVDYYQKDDYMVYVNNWGAESFNLPKSDYSQVVEYHTNSFPNKTLITWKYPDKPYGNGATVYGFPMIAWGKTTLSLSGYNTNNSLGTIGDIDTFNVNYDVTLSGDLQYMNLMHNLFMYDSSGKVAGEITYNVAPDDHILYWGSPNNYFGTLPGAHSYQFTSNGHAYNMLVSTSQNSNTTKDSRMIIIIPTDGSRLTVGTIRWADVLKILIDNKDLSPDLIFKGTEMGVEVQAGSGSMLVNNFAVVLTMKNSQARTQASMTAQATAAVTQINAVTLQQMVGAALANPQSTTYGFSQGNAGIGTNIAINNRLTLGTSTVFAPNGYTLASSLAWRNKNTHALFMTGTGNMRINNTNTQSTFALLEAGTRIPTRLASFEPYARLGYTRHYNTATNLTSMRVSSGINAYVPLSRRLLLRMSGEVANEFNGRGTAAASVNGFSATAPINISGAEYSGSVNLSNGVGMIEAGSKRNSFGTSNYVSAGMRVPF